MPYFGIADELIKIRSSTIFGQKSDFFESTHERSHIFCVYGMSPFKQGDPCYILIWEGQIGSFYEVDKELHICQHGPVLSFPGFKYSFLYDLADPSSRAADWRLDTPGKLMALAGYSKRTEPTVPEQRVIDQILRDVSPTVNDKTPFRDSPYADCGLMNPEFHELVGRFSDALFNTFYSYAQKHLRKGYPLLIAGGCGLNCEWNSKWRDSGLFSDVFVPPVANDSGSAIGTAIEAQYAFSNRAKVSWNTYSGTEFVWDGLSCGFVECALDFEAIVDLLVCEKVIAWVQGRSEIGPRALGNRSLLASPFREETKDRLNRIKQRESYRPIAPVCLEEDASRLFGVRGSSPYMLYFYKSRVKELEAVTHADGSARVQTVNSQQNSELYKLLTAFKHRTGLGVLCNTSLNRKGKGFINRSSDLFSFSAEKGIDGIVIGARLYLPAHNNTGIESPQCTAPLPIVG